jgi:hypothetical protein
MTVFTPNIQEPIAPASHVTDRGPNKGPNKEHPECFGPTSARQKEWKMSIVCTISVPLYVSLYQSICRDSRVIGIRFENTLPHLLQLTFSGHNRHLMSAMAMQSTGKVFQVFVLLALLSFKGVDSFPSRILLSHSFVAKKYAFKPQSQRNHSRRTFRLHISENDDANKENEESVSPKGDFDGAGFANYLAPYALALVGSIAVTAAFLKFVLLDY